MKRALVLGAAGFVGRYVARALSGRGYDVSGIGHGSWAPDEQRSWGVRGWKVADVTLDALLNYGGQPDLIVQCAGSGSVAFSMTNPVQDFERTVFTTLASLEFVRTRAPECRVVLPSSAAVYGTVRQMPIDTTEQLNPVSPYGTHKVIAEDLCRSYSRHFGINAAIVRLFSVYGVGLRKQLLWDACRKLSSGETAFDGTGDERRDWLHVEDAARLLAVAAERAAIGCPVANGGVGTAVDVRAVLNIVAAALPNAVQPTFSGAQRGGDPVHYEADIDLALSWGWRPKRALKEGIEDYVGWYGRVR